MLYTCQGQCILRDILGIGELCHEMVNTLSFRIKPMLDINVCSAETVTLSLPFRKNFAPLSRIAWSFNEVHSISELTGLFFTQYFLYSVMVGL